MCGRRHSGDPENAIIALVPLRLSSGMWKYVRSRRLVVAALNRFTWHEGESERRKARGTKRIGRQRRGRGGGERKRSEEMIGPHRLRLDDLAFLGEETRGDLGSRPPLRRYGYAEVSDNGTSSTLPPVVFSFLPPCAPATVSSSSSSFSSSSGVALAHNHFW